VRAGPQSDKSAPTHPQEGIEIGVMDDLQIPDKELRCESCGREIKVERGEQSHPVWQKSGVIRTFCTLPMCDLDARVVEEEEERANA
jgi:hypothetical protein